MTVPLWISALITIFVVLAAAFVGAFIGVLAGVEWERRRGVRSLRTKRADILRALEHDER